MQVRQAGSLGYLFKELLSLGSLQSESGLKTSVFFIFCSAVAQMIIVFTGTFKLITLIYLKEHSCCIRTRSYGTPDCFWLQLCSEDLQHFCKLQIWSNINKEPVLCTHQLTPSASTQANLYSLTLNISWRQPATHWTYWELWKCQRWTRDQSLVQVTQTNTMLEEVKNIFVVVHKPGQHTEEHQSNTCTPAPTKPEPMHMQSRHIYVQYINTCQVTDSIEQYRATAGGKRAPSHLSRVM